MSRGRLSITLKSPEPDPPKPGMPMINGILPTWMDVEVKIDGVVFPMFTRLLIDARAGNEIPKVLLECYATDLDIDVPIEQVDATVRDENIRLRKALKAIEDHEAKKPDALQSHVTLNLARNARLHGESR